MAYNVKAPFIHTLFAGMSRWILGRCRAIQTRIPTASASRDRLRLVFACARAAILVMVMMAWVRHIRTRFMPPTTEGKMSLAAWLTAAGVALIAVGSCWLGGAHSPWVITQNSADTIADQLIDRTSSPQFDVSVALLVVLVLSLLLPSRLRARFKCIKTSCAHWKSITASST